MSPLIAFLSTHDVDIMLIGETKLTDKDRLNIRHYVTHRQDRTGDTRAGGVAALVRQTIPHERVTFPATDNENVAVRLPGNTYVVSAYNKPKHRIFERDLDGILDVGGGVLLIGDLNVRHGDWNLFIYLFIYL
ncbi:hypothetical protein Zmor_000634 [Zophobas morio]|uniref:Endonuclease/exonuclease/phosphatase domain-containing protein n=1 Tax=Zophobas morio TaxID=2755281 RepID=A0AA38MQW3_9CUCU|nr:hypothetical protein Zmor_000634 [Zophobas morio]